jgi:hypothetical protein
VPIKKHHDRKGAAYPANSRGAGEDLPNATGAVLSTTSESCHPENGSFWFFNGRHTKVTKAAVLPRQEVSEYRCQKPAMCLPGPNDMTQY